MNMLLSTGNVRTVRTCDNHGCSQWAQEFTGSLPVQMWKTWVLHLPRPTFSACRKSAMSQTRKSSTHNQKHILRCSCECARPREESMCEWHEGQQGDADLQQQATYSIMHCFLSFALRRWHEATTPISAVCRQAARERLPKGRSPKRIPDTSTFSTTESIRTLPGYKPFLLTASFVPHLKCKTCGEFNIEANSSHARCLRADYLQLRLVQASSSPRR